MLKPNERSAATRRLIDDRDAARAYAAPGSIEDQRAAGEYAGRRWALQLATHAELSDLADAGRSGTTAFAAGFNAAALDVAAELFPLDPSAVVPAAPPVLPKTRYS